MSAAPSPSHIPRLAIEGLHSLHLGPIDLELAAGECVCLSGSSGAGKSLLLRALADLDPHEGTVRLNGHDCLSLVPAQWRRRVGYLHAESQWWLDRVGAHFPHGIPQGLEQLGLPAQCMEWEVGRCSTGERQRLALLRLLANRPEVLLLDEPTASLDPTATAAAEALVAEYRTTHQAAVLWVSHDPGQIARVADRHFRVEAGQLKEVPV